MSGDFLYKGTGVYIITERLYSRDGVMPSFHGIGPSMLQVHKMVFELSRKQEVLVDGTRVTPDSATLWQRLKIISGIDLVERDSPDGEVRFVMQYSGSSFITVPLSGLDSLNIPDWLKADYKLPTKRILSYGKDPLPNINIYGRSNVNFILGGGGKGTPEAAAKYDKSSNQMVIIQPGAELNKIMLSLQRVVTGGSK